MEVLGYIAAVFMGATLGMIGSGGSILTVPILVYLFGISPSVATGYSLFIVGSTALAGSFSYIRKGEVQFKTALNLALPGFAGVYLSRSVLHPSIPGQLFNIGETVVTKDTFLMTLFSLLMLISALSMIRGRSSAAAPKRSSSLQSFSAALQGFGIGLIAGLVGAGGGFLIVPALVFLAGLDMKTAVGTSLLIIAINTLFGFTGDLDNHDLIDWPFLISIAAVAIVGILLGTAISRRISDTNLKKAFGWLVLLMGCGILFDQLY